MGQLNLNRVRENRAKRAAKESRGDFWKCGPGVNRIRLALFNSPITGNEEYCREILVHQERGTQPVICGKSVDRYGEEGEGCPECDRARTVYEEDGKDAAKGLWARPRTAFLCVPLEKGSKPFKNQRLYPFWAASTVAKAIDAVIGDCDEVTDVRDYFGPEGLDFKITFNPKASPMEMYQVKVMPKVKSESLDPALFAIDPAKHDLYQSAALEPVGWTDPTPERASQPGEVAEATESAEDEAPAEEAPKKKAPSKKKAAAKDGPAEPGKPNSEGFFDEANAKQYLDFYGYTDEGWRIQTDDEGDAAFAGPDGEVKWEPPVPSPEREAKARGMTPRKKKRPANPPAEEDNAETE